MRTVKDADKCPIWPIRKMVNLFAWIFRCVSFSAKFLGAVSIVLGLLAYSPKNFAKSKLRKKQFTELKSLEFSVGTNVPGTSFKGYLKKSLPIRKGRLVIPPRRLTTELELRDKHMYKKIFKKKKVVFEGVAKCYKDIKCKIVGKLRMADKRKNVKFIARRSGQYFKATHTIKLTDFDIEIPEFLGVRVEDAIAITVLIR